MKSPRTCLDMEDTIDRYMGCLIGQCIGDGGGFPVEVRTADRPAPMGLFYSRDRLSLVKRSCEQLLTTHKDSRAQTGALVIAAAVAKQAAWR